MSPTMPLAPHSAPYTPASDVMDRHEYGVTKNRKAASNGGGRAWSEDEEVYLLQTRLQKMPYKHIAAHLKKTELACRLHYHQLSHGSSRRKRTTSVSSGSSGHSPTLPATVSSPVIESPTSRSSSPPGSSGNYGPSSPGHGMVQLPSIVANHISPRLPAILPKPAAMKLPPPTASPTAHGYPTPMSEPRSAALPSATFPPLSAGHTGTPSLRLDCSAFPPPTSHHGHIDMNRLQAIYVAHRASFWAAIAADYGSCTSPMALEQAWKTGICCHHHQTNTPISPTSSPDHIDREVYGKLPQDKTRISAILGIDANPRSPLEREMVRRIEEERNSGVAICA